MIRKVLGAPFRAVGARIKAAMRWSGRAGPFWQFLLPRTKFNYGKEVGDGTGNSIVVACVNWIARTFPEAPVTVLDEGADGQLVRVPRHPFPRLIERPNPYYPGPLLWYATMVDRATSGNAYWLKVRSREPGGMEGLSKVVEYWWAPSWTMEPKWPDDGSVFISHYEYRPGPMLEPVKYDPRDVVHFRWGLDPENTRKGLSPLYSVLREIFTDDEAANFTASLMRNLGVPGLVISPESSAPGARVSPENAEEIKQMAMQKFGGDKRGEPMVMTAPTKVQVLAFSPEQMELRNLRRVPEERVSAVLGVPAIVAGLGAGLDRATFDNVEKLVEFAIEQGIVPIQRIVAAELTIQALPDFDDNENRSVAFDLTNVRALQPDMDKVYERVDRAVRGGWGKVAEAKRAVGLPVGADDDVYLRPFTIVPTRDGSAAPSMPKGFKASDPANAFAQRMAEARQRIVERFEAGVTAFFRAQAERAMERLAAVVTLRSGNGAGRKQPVVGVRTLMPDEEDDLMAEALRPVWLAGIAGGWGLAAEAFDLEAGFEEDSAATAAVLGEAAHRGRRISDGTRAALSEAFEEGARRGYSLSQVVNGVPDDEFPGLRQRVESYYAGRPLAVVMTETMWATNMGTAAAYRANGFSRVLMIDGGEDPACAARNGAITSISGGEAATNVEHPHGTLTLVPVTT